MPDQKPFQTNHLAIAGFLLPFLACMMVCVWVLFSDGRQTSIFFSMGYIIPTPMVLLGGLAASLKSIPLIEERGDRDYAYAGLFLNVFFLIVYSLSLLYVFYP
ncbi:hypothetical protein [Desulfatiglans anilini]|uniref:hypothetical protein n=1 Tax=Desulfatiglans anilini TaxID=90728 RepID=UPI0003F81563|nr:hypothetical protein [Desulfatiglans anilini]